MTLAESLAAEFRRQLIPAEPEVTTRAPRIDLLEWMGKFRPLLTAGRPFDLHGHEYLRAIYADDAQEVRYKKAAQVGISEYLISWMLYMAAERDCTGFYVMPTDGHVSDFSAARLGPAIDPLVSPKLAALITSGSGGKRGADKVTLKRVGNRFIYFRGGQIQDRADAGHGRRQQSAQLKSVDGDTLVLDELDELDARVPPIARKRLLHSDVAGVRIASTPTYAGMGISESYDETDQREWMMRCISCGERQVLALVNLVLEWDALERPVSWYGKDQGEPYVACRKCNKPLDRAGPGEWVPLYPGRRIHGYHITGLISVRKPLQPMIDGLMSVDETTRKETFNQDLGLSYTPSESEKLTESTLNACGRQYALGPTAGEITYMGIDVGRVLNIVIRGKEPDGNRPLRYAGQHEGFDEALRLVERFKCKTVVIDALPETRKARELQKRLSRLQCWIAYFGDQPKGAKTEQPAHWNARELEVDIDRTRAMDATLALFANAAMLDENGVYLPGNTLPGNARAIRDYYAQMMAPSRILTEDAKGNKIAVYVATQPDHFAFAELYCAMAYLCPYGGWSRGSG